MTADTSSRVSGETSPLLLTTLETDPRVVCRILLEERNDRGLGRAIIDEAHKNGLRVTAHIFEQLRVGDAVRFERIDEHRYRELEGERPVEAGRSSGQ